jgi:hypothetical protein
MEREMKEREEELRKAVEMEKQEREERRQRVKKQLERLYRESRFAVSLFTLHKLYSPLGSLICELDSDPKSDQKISCEEILSADETRYQATDREPEREG